MFHSATKITLGIFLFTFCIAQDVRYDKGKFSEYKSEFWEQVSEEMDAYSTKSGESKKCI